MPVVGPAGQMVPWLSLQQIAAGEGGPSFPAHILGLAAPTAGRADRDPAHRAYRDKEKVTTQPWLSTRQLTVFYVSECLLLNTFLVMTCKSTR